jgi:hypothetical protein
MAEYRFLCDLEEDKSQVALARLVNLAGEDIELSFRLRATCSDSLREVIKALHITSYLNSKVGEDKLDEIKTSVMLGLRILQERAVAEMVMPFSSWTYNHIQDSWNISHKFPNFANLFSYQEEQENVVPIRDELAGFHRIVGMYRAYEIEVKRASKKEVKSQCGALVVLVPDIYRFFQLSLEAEPHEYSGDHVSFKHYAYRAYTDGKEIVFFTPGNTSLEELVKFLNQNKMNFGEQQDGFGRRH